jgi:hypothetical protein
MFDRLAPARFVVEKSAMNVMKGQWIVDGFARIASGHVAA